MKTSLGVWYMVLSWLCFWGVWFFSKMIIQDISPMTFTTLRIAIGLFILCVLGRKYLSKISSIQRQDWKKIVIVSVVWMVLWSIFFTLSIKWTTVTNSSFLFFLPAILLPVLGALYKWLELKKTTYVAILLSIVWLYFLFDPDLIGTSVVGNLFWLLAGISNAVYIVIAKRLAHLPPKLSSIAVFAVLVSTLLVITLVVEWNQFWMVSAASWKILRYLWWCMAWAYVFLNSALQHISSYFTWVLAIWEPLAATALGVLFLWEVLSTQAFIWIWIILLGFALISLDKWILGSWGEE